VCLGKVVGLRGDYDVRWMSNKKGAEYYFFEKQEQEEGMIGLESE